MKIVIRQIDENKKRGLSLTLPNFLLKSNFIIKIILKSVYKNINTTTDLKKLKTKTKTFIKGIYKKLKKYTKKYGHFTLIDITSDDFYLKIIV